MNHDETFFIQHLAKVHGIPLQEDYADTCEEIVYAIISFNGDDLQRLLNSVYKLFRFTSLLGYYLENQEDTTADAHKVLMYLKTIYEEITTDPCTEVIESYFALGNGPNYDYISAIHSTHPANDSFLETAFTLASHLIMLIRPALNEKLDLDDAVFARIQDNDPQAIDAYNLSTVDYLATFPQNLFDETAFLYNPQATGVIHSGAHIGLQ